MSKSIRKKIYNIALRSIGNHADVSDLAQEVLIRIYKSIGSFKEQSSLSTWIYRITANACLDEIRKQKNRRAVSFDDEIKLDDGEVKKQYESDDPLPEEIAEKKELGRMVKRAIEKLSGEHRMVIILRDIQGMSYEEISRILACPEGTVKSRINRARAALKNILKADKELLPYKYVK